MTASLALEYPRGSSNEQLRAALVRLIDVVRVGLDGSSSADLAALQAALDALTDSFFTLSGDVNLNMGQLEVALAQLQSEFASLVAEALTEQQLLEIAIDHAREDVSGSRAEFERWIQDEHIRLADAIMRLRQLVQDNSASIIDEQVVRVSESESFAQTVAGVVADLADTTALVLSEQTARATADEALATDITAIEASVASNTASINTLSTAYAAADAAMAAQITTLQSDVAGNTAAITSEALTRSTADTALSGLITSLTTTVDANTAAITSEALTRSTEDLALASQIDTVEAATAATAAAVAAEAIARADGDSALAASVSTVSTTVGANTASITAINASIDGLQASWSVSVDINGHVAGLVRLSGDDEGSTFTVLSDSFLVASPNGSNPTPMFGVGQVNGVTTVGILGNALIDGSVLARHITVGSLDAISANIGTITAGVLQSPGGETFWNLTTGEFYSQYYTDLYAALFGQLTAAEVALNAAVDDVLAAVGLVADDVAALQVGTLSAQDRFEIALDHAIDTVSGSRLEFQRHMEDELLRITDLVLNVRRFVNDNSALITTEQVARITETEVFASQLTALTADLASTSAALVTEQIARVDGDNALASSVSTVQADVASNSASITTIQTVQSGIQSDVSSLESDVTGIKTDLGQVQAQWGVAINVNGQVVGLVQMDGSSSGSQFTVVADKFTIAHPSAPGTLITPVVVGLVNGVSTIGLNGSVLVDGTILARHIAANQIDASKLNVATLSAIAANLGTVTAGLIQNPAGTLRFDLPNMRLYRTDGTMDIDLGNKTISITF